MATHYNSSSRGLIEITSMNYRHAVNAHDKLIVEDVHGLRKDELDALRAHIKTLEDEQTVEGRVNG